MTDITSFKLSSLNDFQLQLHLSLKLFHHNYLIVDAITDKRNRCIEYITPHFTKKAFGLKFLLKRIFFEF
jgi:hypothetical protein